MHDLDEVARLTVRLNNHMAGDSHERYELAFSAAAEYLYSTDEAPTRRTLVDAASRAMNSWMHGVISSHGISRRHGGEFGSAPRFSMYWWDQTRCVQSPEASVVENLALGQIFQRLPQGEREALLALATHRTYQAAALALGTSLGNVKAAVNRGRVKFRRLWHQGEKPSPHWAQDRRGGREDVGFSAQRLIAERRRRGGRGKRKGLAS
jgi:DNA-directed RNA polymerase specialized sigma24 family protein